MSYNTGNDSLINDVVYSRDVSGRELAIYENGSIDKWNFYGMDNAGFIDGNDNIRYYMKDHLGSVRAVTDGTGSVVSSQDYDAWGYLLENRVYESDENIYKFTSKERDEENQYDYFGARYYDARVGRWGQVEPLLDKYISYSPYQYGILNPLKVIDVNGLDVFLALSGNAYSSSGEINDLETGTGKTVEAIQNLINEYGLNDFDVIGFYTPIIGNEVVDKAVNFIVQNLQNENEKVYLYGYSLGGLKILDVANELNNKGINVEILFDVDPSGITFEKEKEVAPNVKTAYYWYTKASEQDRIKLSSKSGKTKIIPFNETNTGHREIDEKVIDYVKEKIREKIKEN
ncbi:MAG TPA: RHS repeat-associated core domain-containing protein [Ignavibacteria bacterium]|nr:RHS repeat-associated core domain-containing protein [Ignavibacteria bacterium]HMR41996.1 RHS repeat-associated core domain-containing protein [Ignavibacteria bacterium]